MDVFDTFTNSDYTFLKLSQGGILGNTETESDPAQGILKERKGLTVGANAEVKTSATTLKIKPNEPFIAELNGELEGHGIRASKNGNASIDYRIIGMTEGYDYDLGQIAFYVLTLKRESLAT